MAVCSLFSGVALAWNHPLWPAAVLLALVLWSLVVAWWRPGAWLLVVPACVGFLNFSPWTGWLVFDEFDILLLGTLAGGYGRLAYLPPPPPPESEIHLPKVVVVLIALLGGLGLLALYRGFADAGGFAFDWFAGYTDALNSLRVFKSLGFALLCMPLLQRELDRGAERASKRLATGMVAGLAVVVLAVLWERAAFPGVFNFTSNYRTAALFWEMHVGGAAIDGYLALAAPFAVWAVRSARRPALWVAAAALALLTGYAVLTTFARGVYFAVLGALVLLGVLLHCHRPTGWRAKASLVLVLALLAEVAVVLGVGTFMVERLASTDQDFASRLAHWRQGLDLLKSPQDWWLGKGLGRLPSLYANQAPLGEFSGDARVHETHTPGGIPNRFVTIDGPRTLKTLGGQYALTQRVRHLSKGPYHVSMDIRVHKDTDIQVELCERHLLYEGLCQRAFVRVSPLDSGWQPWVLPLLGTALEGSPWYAPRLALLSLSVANADASADFDNLRLFAPHQPGLLENGDFSQGLAQWFPAAQSYFLPWHIDNLFLEMLVERGLSGLLVWSAVVGYALWQLVWGHARPHGASPYFAASLGATLCVGLVSSLMDVPRVAFLFYFLTLFSLQIRASQHPDQGLALP